jgi:D-alanyl-D-alanine carboxypeptidase/D-alanyl-D-alanine-endopeptidase (penicillin-binding protein 4)
MGVRRAWIVVAALLAAALSAVGSSAPAAAGSPELRAELAGALRTPDVARASTAALAVDLRTGEVVFGTNARLALAPASAEKLAVSYAALRVLGTRFRFRTEVVGTGELVGTTWRGDLFLVGSGDPTLSLEDLHALAGDVAALGIRRVTGRVLGDEGHFDTRRVAPGWRPSFLVVESPPLSALSVRELPFTGRNASASAAARAFAQALARRGVSVSGAPGARRAAVDALPVAERASEPLSKIVGRMNRDSDNFVAEMVLKELGSTIARRGSTAAGARVVRAALAEAQVPLAGVRIADGSGLSAFDRLTARALVAILQAGREDSELGSVFVGSLAVAGVSGTLEDRLATRPTRGRVLAKTGTTRRASALAGFVGRRYAFAIVQNGSPLPYWSARAAQDRFVTVLARP